MKFGEKLKEQRKKRKMLQTELAAAIGVTKFTIINYEKGSSYPKDRSIYHKLADIFCVDVNYFLTEDDEFLSDVAEMFGKRGLEQAQSLLDQAAAMFAGGELSEDDQLAFLRQMQLLFVDSKLKAGDKFTPRKYRKKNEPDAD